MLSSDYVEVVTVDRPLTFGQSLSVSSSRL